VKISPGTLILPGPKEIQIVHQATIEKHGGLNVQPDRHRIKNALSGVITYHCYHPDADISLLAAALAYNFAKGHPLPDGNKRVAFVAIKMITRLNGFSWKPRHKQAEEKIYSLAESNSSDREQVLDGFAAWIRQDTSDLYEKN
jgi:death-on-curing family protein